MMVTATQFSQYKLQGSASKMVSKLPQEFRKFLRNCYHLQRILRETQKSLDEITTAGIFPGEDLKAQVLTPLIVRLTSILERHPALVVLGQSCQAKALLVNALLGEVILPPGGRSWRWIRFLYGLSSNISVTLSLDFDSVGDINSPEKPCTVIPEEDLKRSETDSEGLADLSTILDIEICHPLLKDSVQLIIPPDCDDLHSAAFREVISKGMEKVLPLFLYAIGEDSLTDQNIHELRELKQMFPELPVFFICTSASPQELTESEQHQLQEHNMCFQEESCYTSQCLHSGDIDKSLTGLIQQLARIGYLHLEGTESGERSMTTRPCCGQFSVGSDFLDGLHKLDQLLFFVRGCLQSHLVQVSSTLNDIHSKCLRRFILSAFDMAREIQITPRRIHYAEEKEADLYRSLMMVANEKQEEITRLIEVTLQEMREDLIEIAAEYQYHGVTVLDSEEVESPQDVLVATSEIQHLVLTRLSSAVAQELVQSVHCLQDTFVGTLQRCLESLEKNCYDQERSLSASDAVKQILTAAYNVKLTTSSSSSFLQTFLERLRKLLHTFQLPWTATRRLDVGWKKRVATEMLDSLSAARLSKSISTQFRDKVRSSHESFQSALRSLESHYSGRLERTEEQRIAIRKYHTPRLARLALESTSMCDMIRYGMPVQGKEIGRGQYGVVFACESWGGTGPCAVKSVVPPDDKHWNDLAMEFYYTRTVPEHKHIVKLRGSVVDHTYGGGFTPAVLLVMDRLSQDLYCGLRSGLRWLVRLQIAIDVVEGIRYLHSQGLVHRDIKLKNVLLDHENRAKLTDLGFCIPEAMMSGSIVGTPVHMAPELLSGHYDSSVDVYAFGILFWYICAGHVKLPLRFEQFQNKEQLWTGVKKGTRPEKLQCFDEQCWQLMQQCWAAEPFKRPLLGDVLPLLQSIKARYALKFSQDNFPADAENVS
ncbi:dual serine/threonine and tyrosine protein kinase-like [Periplaneta americana]|uniref:dual serine/threonine and tyrosine protein kinase-like n=1 Tax=Periplaneta americana TaxID=6978 RepID=UPI0037E828D5